MPPKIKTRVLRQRACNELNEKGKICAGHLKRWYLYPKDIQALLNGAQEVYRCEKCKTVYLPNPEEIPRTGTLAW